MVHKGGRPTDYDKKYCDEIVKYFETCQAEILVNIKFFMPNKNVTVKDILNPLGKEEDEGEKLQAGAVKEIEQNLVMNRFPTFIRYARMIGVNQTTLFERKKKHKEFSKSMAMCKEIQEAILLENGLQGTYNSQFAQFLLKNNHGYKDKQEVDHGGQANNPIVTENTIRTPEEVKASLLNRLRKK